MLEKLLSVFLQAKGGAVATVFVLGTGGALVTATAESGMTNAAITQETTDQSGSTTTTDDSTTATEDSTTTTTVDQAILALFTRTNAEEDPTSTATAKGCLDEALARNEQMFRVNDAFIADHLTVVAFNRGVRAADDRQLVQDAGEALRDIRQAAVKAIHGTFDCDPGDDEDENNEDENNEDNSSTTTDSPDFTGLDAEAIADLAIEAMTAVVEDLKAALGDVEVTTPAANTRRDDTKSDNAPGAAGAANAGNASKGRDIANANSKGRGGERN
ncbi:MAG: hypothetical protein WEE03_06975 [Chloroflexota bacterium]